MFLRNIFSAIPTLADKPLFTAVSRFAGRLTMYIP